MASQANPDLAADQITRKVLGSGRPVVAKSAERPLLWGVQAQVDYVANSFGPEVEVIAIPLADGGTAYEFRKASASLVEVAA